MTVMLPHRPPPAFRPAILALLMAASLCPPALGYPTAQEALKGTPFQDDHIQRILDGELVTTRIRQGSCHEFSVGLACLVTQDRVGLMRSIREGTWIAQSPSLMARGEIQGQGSLEALEGLGLDPGELRRYLQARPGAVLNLSPDEIALLRKIRPSGQADAEALTTALREMLLRRYRTYRARGLEGIAPYVRQDGALVHPGAELRRSLAASRTLRALFPDLYRTLVRYPAPPPKGVTERFFWGRLRIDDQPAFSLNHRLSMGDAQLALLIERAFYVSHTLDASQTVLALLPVVEGRLLLYVNRVWTDRVGGLGCPVKRIVGRYSVLDAMREIIRGLGVCGFWGAPQGAGEAVPD